MRQWYGARATIVPCVTFRDAFDAYANGAADAIVTAVENTIFGSINEVYQLIESDAEAFLAWETSLAEEGILPLDLEHTQKATAALSPFIRFLHSITARSSSISMKVFSSLSTYPKPPLYLYDEDDQTEVSKN